MPMRILVRILAVLVALMGGGHSPVHAQARGPGQSPAAGRGCDLPEPFPCPVARILDLRAEPAAINPGDTARITWATENPTNSTLLPGVGRITARGSARVTPAATTTYTLRSEGGPNGEAVTRSITVLVRGTQPVAAAVAPTGPRPVPRMPDGKPDLQGVWFGGGFGLPGPRGRGAGPGARATGPAPVTTATLATGPTQVTTSTLPMRPTPKPGREDLRIVNDPLEVGAGCGVRSVPIYFGPVYHFQIVQTPQTVVQLVERMHLYRIFQIGGEHSVDVMNGEKLSYLGESMASWDGDTLVVDTRGFNLRTAVGTNEGAFSGGFRHSTKLHLVERIRRLDFDTLEIESTMDDPDLFTGPWRLTTRHELRPEFSRVDEYICEQAPDFYKPLLEGLPPDRGLGPPGAAPNP
jgi:hypothetical protein